MTGAVSDICDLFSVLSFMLERNFFTFTSKRGLDQPVVVLLAVGLTAALTAAQLRWARRSAGKCLAALL